MSEFFRYRMNEKGIVITSSNVNVEELDIPEEIDGLRVVEIEEHAFEGCSRLRKITLPKGVEVIGEGAFAECAGLTAITIPKGVKLIPPRAFSGCVRLVELNLPESLESIGDYAFNRCASLVEVKIPEGTHSMDLHVFEQCSKLKHVSLPKSLRLIGNGVFWNCTELASIDIPEGVKSIGREAFSYCSKLTEINLPKGIETIEQDLFWDCVSLAKVGIPDGLKYIELSAFWGCTSLVQISLPEGLICTSPGAFSYCTNLVEIKKGNKTYEVKCIDGFCMEVIHRRRAYGAEILKVKYFERQTDCWVARIGDHYAHGLSIKDAVEDCQFKHKQADFDLEEEVARIKLEDKVTVQDYRLLTGACSEGCRKFLESLGDAKESYSVEETIELVQGQYGSERFIELLGD